MHPPVDLFRVLLLDTQDHLYGDPFLAGASRNDLMARVDVDYGVHKETVSPSGMLTGVAAFELPTLCGVLVDVRSLSASNRVSVS
jgi:hypothetical protein